MPSWLDSLRGLTHELPGLIGDRIELLSLELRRAGLTLARMVALIVAASILGVTAWLALWACAVGALMAAGLHWSAALLLVLVINLGACAWALVQVRKLAPLLQLPITRKHLSFDPAPLASQGVQPDASHAHASHANATRASAAFSN